MKEKFPVDDNIIKLDTDTTINPSCDVIKANTLDHSYSAIKPGGSDVPVTINQPYDVPTKLYSKTSEEDYNYVQPNGLIQHNIHNSIKMNTDPAYGVSRGDTKIHTDPAYGVSKEDTKMDTDPAYQVSKGDTKMNTDPAYGVSRGDSKMNTDPAYEVSKGDKMNTDPAYEVSKGDKMNTDPAYEVSKGDKMNTDPAYEVSKGDKMNTDPAYEVSKGDKMNTDPAYEVSKGDAKMNTDSAYIVNIKERVAAKVLNTKASHDTTTEQYNYVCVRGDHLLHHNTSANTTGDAKDTLYSQYVYA